MSRSTGDDIVGIIASGFIALLALFALVILLPFKVLRIAPQVSEFVDDLWGKYQPRQSEVAETKALWDEARTLRAHSPLASRSSSDLYCSAVREAVISAELFTPPHVTIIDSMLDATECLLETDGAGEVPDVDWTRPLGLEEGVRLRNHFRLQIRFLGDAEHHLALWTETMRGVLEAYLRALPESAYTPNADDDADTTATGSLSVEVVDLLHRPAELIEQMMLSFYTEDLKRTKLFEVLRSHFDELYQEANEVYPTEAVKLSPQKLIDTYLAGTPLAPLFRNSIPFTIPEASRFEHCMIVAGTGHGKTQTLQSMILDDLERVREGACSVVVIDSQGDLINTILRLDAFSPSVEDSIADRLMLIDPNDVEHPACLNMFATATGRLDGYSAVEREKILNGVIELFEYVFGALLGAELTQKQGVIFRYIARLMLIIPGATIQTLIDLMEDGARFKPYMEELEGSSRKFFETQFFNKSFNATKTQILRRLWGVMSNRTFERMFSQPENKVDMFAEMGAGKVILINTAKDLLKQEGSEIFGRFFISMIAQAALERAVVSPDERTATYVYVDEAQEYFGGDDRTFEMLLGQARKYKIGFTTAMQTLSQASPRLRASMMSNTSTKLAGGVSDGDARAFASEMRVDADFIRDMHKRATGTEFACFVRHLTPNAIRLSVPLGRMEQMPTMSQEDYESLLDENRTRYAKPFVDATVKVDVPPQPKPTEREEPVTVVDDHEPVTKPPQRPPRARPEMRGRGGTAHKDIQNALRTIGHELGFLAEIEDEVFDSENRARQIDVALRKEGILIACEISITTKPEREVENIARSFDAGVHHVFVVAPDPKHRQDIETTARAELRADQFVNVSVVLSADEVKTQLARLDISPRQKETVMRGYKVQTHFNQGDPTEAARRREAFARALLRGDE